MARRYRSRLARKESKRLMRQSILLFILTGIVVVALVIWGVPAMIRFMSFLGEVRSSSIPIDSDDTLAPYTPQLSIPYEATSSAQIDINGYGESASTIKLFNNEEEISSTQVDDQGEFVFEAVRLQSGENQFQVNSTDDAGNQSDMSRPINVSYDNVAPELTIDEPSDGDSYFTSQEQNVQVIGTVDEPSVQVYVNDRLASVDNEGNYSQRVYLEEGDNQITVVAVDDAGNQSETSITVSFRR